MGYGKNWTDYSLAGWLAGVASAAEPADGGKIGENALAHLNKAPFGQKVEIDITFSAQPYGMPFHRAGLDDDPRALAQVRESVLSSAGLNERDVTFDASDIGVMSVMIDAQQAQRLAAHPLVRSLGVLPECVASRLNRPRCRTSPMSGMPDSPVPV